MAGPWMGPSCAETLGNALAAFPGILMAIVILSALGPGLRNAMIAIGIPQSPAILFAPFAWHGAVGAEQ